MPTLYSQIPFILNIRADHPYDNNDIEGTIDTVRFEVYVLG